MSAQQPEQPIWARCLLKEIKEAEAKKKDYLSDIDDQLRREVALCEEDIETATLELAGHLKTELGLHPDSYYWNDEQRQQYEEEFHALLSQVAPQTEPEAD